MRDEQLLNMYIRKYYHVLRMSPAFPHRLYECFLARGQENPVIISDNKIFRGIARALKIKRSSKQKAQEIAIQFFAMDEAFQLLQKKGVPVYFYNRVGKKKNGYKYRDSEMIRMKKSLTFPLMYESIDKYKMDLKEILGDLYSKDYVEKIGKIPQVIKVNGTYIHENCKSEFVNVEDGKRITVNQPKNFQRTLHIYGRCGAFGYAVEDAHTIPSFLQKELINRGANDIRVVNHGLWGGEDSYIDHNFLQDVMGFKEGDIVLFYRKHFPMQIIEQFMLHGVRYMDITDEWHKRRAKNDKITFYNQPGHMNAYGYNLVAKIICDDLCSTDFGMENVTKSSSTVNVDALKYYLKTHVDFDFAREVESYIQKIQKLFPSEKNNSNGAIVMNCNPFTNGHRYLIEHAAKQVDRLYIFVVEENKSFFLFEDRLTMVKNGTEDLPNVVVVPSGKFIISAYTFPEYFMKDYVKEKDFDVSLDLKTFCQYIAPPLNIKFRFAGEEPFDPVTNNYNDNMKNILPKYGINFCEIKRMMLDEKQIVSATMVRELMKANDWNEIARYVPQTTLDILRRKYSNN